MSEAQQPDSAPVSHSTEPAGTVSGRMIVTIGSLALTAAMLVALVLIQIPEGNRELFNIALGAALGWTSSVISYHVGSSAGSAAKDVALNRISGVFR